MEQDEMKGKLKRRILGETKPNGGSLIRDENLGSINRTIHRIIYERNKRESQMDVLTDTCKKFGTPGKTLRLYLQWEVGE